MKLHASGEDYLEAVLMLQKQKGMVRSIDLARHMGYSKPSICHAVKILRDGGFLTMDENAYLHLTDVGREIAEKIYERHQLFTKLLIDVGIDPVTAEQEACRMEHTDIRFLKYEQKLAKKEQAQALKAAKQAKKERERLRKSS